MIIRAHPVSGIGIGGYPLAQERGANRVPGARGEKREASNMYLRVAAETGWRKLQESAPRQARQSYYLELGLAGNLLGGVFGSYGMLAFLCLNIAIIFAAAEVVEAEWRAGARIARVCLVVAGVRLPRCRALPVQAVSPHPLYRSSSSRARALPLLESLGAAQSQISIGRWTVDISSKPSIP